MKWDNGRSLSLIWEVRISSKCWGSSEINNKDNLIVVNHIYNFYYQLLSSKESISRLFSDYE